MTRSPAFTFIAGIVVAAFIALVVLAILGDWLKGMSMPLSASAWRRIFNLVAFIAFLAVVIAVASVARQEIDSKSGFLAAIVATSALIPISVAEVGSVVAYVLSLALPAFPAWAVWVKELALLIGALAALVAWIGWAVFYRPLASVASQNASEYAALSRRYSDLDSNLASWYPARPGPADVTTDPVKAFTDAAYWKIQACKQEIAAVPTVGRP